MASRIPQDDDGEGGAVRETKYEREKARCPSCEVRLNAGSTANLLSSEEMQVSVLGCGSCRIVMGGGRG